MRKLLLWGLPLVLALIITAWLLWPKPELACALAAGSALRTLSPSQPLRALGCTTKPLFSETLGSRTIAHHAMTLRYRHIKDACFSGTGRICQVLWRGQNFTPEFKTKQLAERKCPTPETDFCQYPDHKITTKAGTEAEAYFRVRLIRKTGGSWQTDAIEPLASPIPTVPSAEKH